MRKFVSSTLLTILLGSSVATATTIVNTSLFLDNRFNDITFTAEGPRLQIGAFISDTLGVPDNIVSVRAEHTTTGNSYRLFFSPRGNFSTPTSAPYLRSRNINLVPLSDRAGRYSISVLNQQGDVVLRTTHFLTATEQLGIPSNLQITGSALVPTVTSDPVPGADQYQLRIWDSDIERIYNSPLSSTPVFTVPSGILNPENSYSFSVRGLDFDSFGNLERRSATFLPYVTPLPPTPPVISGRLDPNKPTIVVTHGWQPDTGGPRDFWWTDMAQNIANRKIAGGDPSNPETYGDVYNIIAYEWADAFLGSSFTDALAFNRVKATVPNHGSALAKLLVQELGVTYNKDIHFIGHSFGSIVNATATNLLTKVPGWDVEQFTILDAPLRTPFIDYPINYFKNTLPETKVKYVDNYYGNPLLFATGAPFCDLTNLTCAYEKSLTFRGHSGVREYYAETITDPLIGDGFFYDALGGGKAARPNSPWDPRSGETLLVALLNPVIDDAWIQVGDVTLLFNEARLFSSSPAGIATSLLIPENTEYLSFDFLFLDALGDEFLTVLIDEITVFSFLASSFFQPDTYQNSGLLPIEEFAGGTHKLTFWLLGQSGVELGIKNIAFIGSEAVPEPGTVLLFLFGLVIMWRSKKVRVG
jgi:hypothetical protein